MSSPEPSYIETCRNGQIYEKIEKALQMIKACTLCPRKCGIDRTAGETGVCKTGSTAVISSFHPHFGEEAPLVGSGGSGTIFFTHCNLMCNFCQNYDISHQGLGDEATDEQLANMMLILQNQGCHNINFVTPSHVVPQILSAVEIAASKGLSVPLVYNTGGYDSVETLKLLENVFDIYMPDFKFWDPEIAKLTCDVLDYKDIACSAVLEMHRQVGDLEINKTGIAVRGVLIRHLVLPALMAGTDKVMTFIAEKVSPNTYINIMPQYRPCGRAFEIKKLARPLSGKEYEEALDLAKQAGLKRLDRRERVFIG